MTQVNSASSSLATSFTTSFLTGPSSAMVYLGPSSNGRPSLSQVTLAWGKETSHSKVAASSNSVVSIFSNGLLNLVTAEKER